MTRDDILKKLAASRPELDRFHVERLSVFGSVARNEASDDSDVDVLVEFDPDVPVGLFAFVGLLDFLEDVLGTRIDLATPDALRPEMRDRILEEAVRAF